ncbi:hypothetical protein L3Q82_005517 [Scortum barcoo]|uniref:Uncharacterized protein n=1 Tax=Scortum barcoo TaxID=214431 RepID=A0ACB8VA99_9TELE|nr:hypothetical protein L3Q82_005517 [Scortum barcoo]
MKMMKMKMIMGATLKLLSVLLLVETVTAEYLAVCQSVEAEEGEDVTLRYRLDPPIDLSAYTVDVRRADSRDGVHAYRHRQDHLYDQADRYRGRTALVHEDLSRGILTLQVSSVKQADGGPYRFLVPKLGVSCTVHLSVASFSLHTDDDDEDDDEAILKLLSVLLLVETVTAEYLAVCQSVEAEEGEDVTLQYRLDPPIDLSAYTVDADRYRGRTALVHEDLSRGILTLQVSSVKQADGGPYRFLVPKLGVSCTVHLSVVETDQQDVTKRNDSNTTEPPEGAETKPEYGGRAGVIVAAVLSFILLCFVVLLVVRKRAIQDRLRRLRGRTDAQTADEDELQETSGGSCNASWRAVVEKEYVQDERSP